MSHIYNIRINVYRDVYSGDDSYGGSVVSTGIVLYEQQVARLDTYMPSLKLIQAYGLETDFVYSLYIRTNRQKRMDIRPNDYIKVVFPNYHPEYDVRLRVRGIQNESLHPANGWGILECILTRTKETRNNNIF